MSDLALDPVDRDLLVEDSKLVIIDGDAALVQHLIIRYNFFLGEWKLDTELGIPYFQEIFIKNPKSLTVRNIFRGVALGTPGIASLARFDLDLEPETRELAVTFTAVKDDGSLLDFSERFIVG